MSDIAGADGIIDDLEMDRALENLFFIFFAEPAWLDRTILYGVVEKFLQDKENREWKMGQAIEDFFADRLTDRTKLYWRALSSK
ncbi:MAG: hypothetical protein DRR08_18730 [Candidatus Parabeggiatoa sp. nov. 2]|nr:MAG: hypothetical protein DRR08_18730 [Gammaproteobacteria bacterium]